MANHDRDRLVVPLRRGRIALIVLLAAGFVVLGLSTWIYPDFGSRRNLLVKKVISGVVVVFFGAAGLSALWRLLDMRPGLVIDAEGIIDHSSGVSAGRIPWSDIRSLEVTGVQRRGFLTVVVKNPKKYLQRGSFLKRQLVRANAKSFGGPIHISIDALKINSEELFKAVNDSFQKYRHS